MVTNSAGQSGIKNGHVGLPVFGGHHIKTVLKVLSGIVLALSACTGLTIGGLVGVAAIQHAKVLVVTSGSMEPSVHVGSVVFVKKLTGEAQIGDVITFSDAYSTNGRTHLTTHRVIAKPVVDGVVDYQTKGDANPAPDPNLALPGAIVGKVIATIPYVGRLYHFVATLFGKMVLVVLPMMVLVGRELSDVFHEAKVERERKESSE